MNQTYSIELIELIVGDKALYDLRRYTKFKIAYNWFCPDCL